MATLSSKLVLSLSDRVSGPARGIARTLGRLNKTTGSFVARQRAMFAPMRGGLGSIVALGGAYIGLTQGIKGTVGAAMSFEDSMADIRKVIDFKNPGQFQDMRNDILNMSKRLPIAAEGLANIYAAAGQSNVPTAKLSKFAEMTAKVSTAWDMTAGETGSALAEIRTGLGITVEQTGLVADSINHLGNNTAASAQKLLRFTQNVASAAKTAGMAAPQAAAFGAAMIGAGFNPDVAKTSFQNMLRALGSGGDTKRRRMAMKALGFDPKQLQKSLMKDGPKTILNVLDAIKKKIPEHERSSLISNLFGNEAKALAPLIDNTAELRRALNLVSEESKYSGSAFREYEEAAKRTSNSLAKLKNNVRAIGIGLGDQLLPSMAAGAEGLAKVLMTLDERVTVFDRIKAATSGFVDGLGLGDAETALGSFKSAWSDLTTFLVGHDYSGVDEELKRAAQATEQMNLQGMAREFIDLGDNVRSLFDTLSGGDLSGSWTNLTGLAEGIGKLLAAGDTAGFAALVVGGAAFAKLAIGLTALIPIRTMHLFAIAGGIAAISKAVEDFSNGATIPEAIGKLSNLEKALVGVTAAWAGWKAVKLARGASKIFTGGGKTGGKGAGRVAGNGAGKAAGKVAKTVGGAAATKGGIVRGVGKFVIRHPIGALVVGAGAVLHFAGKAQAERRRSWKGEEYLMSKPVAPHMTDADNRREGAATRAPRQSVFDRAGAASEGGAIKTLLNEVGVKATETGQKIKQGLGITARPIVDTSSLSEALIKANALKSALSALPGSRASSSFPKLSGARAKGGRVRAGGKYLVGELGPEIVDMDGNGYVHNASDTAGMLAENRAGFSSAQSQSGSTQSGTVTVSLGGVHVEVHGAQNAEEIADQIVPVLEQRLKDAMSGAHANLEWT